MKKVFIVGLSTIILMACGAGTIADPNNPDEIKNKIAEIADQIQLVIGEASCTEDNQCAAVAMGNKACGGPSFYLPHSTVNTDVNTLTSLAQQHRDLSKQYNQLLGMMSDCAFVMEPPVACVQQRCEVVNQK